jgi:hypothetical protein
MNHITKQTVSSSTLVGKQAYLASFLELRLVSKPSWNPEISLKVIVNLQWYSLEI